MNKKEAHVQGPAIAGIGEIIQFHPIDTIVKRCMSYKDHIFLDKVTYKERIQHILNIVLRDSINLPIYKKFSSQYTGQQYGILYKITQRIYKFGGQPLVYKIQNEYTKDKDSKKIKVYVNALAGGIIGFGEVILVPIDALKIKAQTNPQALKDISYNNILHKIPQLYRGSIWTISRNVPGSLTLFGISSFTREYILCVPSTCTPTLKDIFLSSLAGSLFSIIISSPFDVIKTRVQNCSLQSPSTGTEIIRELINREGFTAFYRGIIPKLCTVGPKIVFSFTMAQYLVMRLSS